MSGNGYASSSQFTPDLNVVSGQGGGEEIGCCIQKKDGSFLRHHLLIDANEAKVSPITECGDESITVTEIMEDDLDDEPTGEGNFNSWNKLVVAANMAKKAETLVVNKQPSHKKSDKQIVHDIDVRWHPCDQNGCDYKSKQASQLKTHKRQVHYIDVRWHRCDQDGCDYKAKQASHVKRHKANVHDIDVRWFPCDQDGCDYKSKRAENLKQHKQAIHGTSKDTHSKETFKS